MNPSDHINKYAYVLVGSYLYTYPYVAAYVYWNKDGRPMGASQRSAAT